MDNVKAKLAMRTPEFRQWMFDEIKITEDEAKKLVQCSACWKNFKWTERTIKKIESKLENITIKNVAPEWRIENKLFHTKEEAIEFIKNSNAEAFQIVSRER